MARNTVPLNQIINDFIITMGMTTTLGVLLTHRSERMRFVVFESWGLMFQEKIRSLKLTIDSSNNTVELPDDYVD